MNQGSATEILRPRMLYEALADALRERIFRHELAPGEPIDEFRLASGYGVSRTPLREALKVLDSEGVVELRARQGCFVVRLAWEDVVQLFDVLDFLEDFAVREAVEARAAIALDGDFHRALAEASGNGYLPDLVERLVDKLRLAFGPHFDAPEMRPSPEFRVALGYAVESGGVDGALGLLRDQGMRRRSAGRALFALLGQATTEKAREGESAADR